MIAHVPRTIKLRFSKTLTRYLDSLQHYNHALVQVSSPNLMRSVKLDIRDGLSDPDVEQHIAIFNLQWNLLGYVTDKLNPGQPLGPILTVSADVDQVYATTCAEYMRWKWPKLDAIEAAISDSHYHYGETFNFPIYIFLAVFLVGVPWGKCKAHVLTCFRSHLVFWPAHFN